MTNQPHLQALLLQLENQRRHSPHSSLVRRAVRLRARNACEYCLRQTINPFHIDHIVPVDLWQPYIAGQIVGASPTAGRRGPDHLDNFAWSCPLCNGSKLQRMTARVNNQTQRIFRSALRLLAGAFRVHEPLSGDYGDHASWASDGTGTQPQWWRVGWSACDAPRRHSVWSLFTGLGARLDRLKGDH